MKKLILFILLQTVYFGLHASDNTYSWPSPSKNSSESMPVGGGDIGLNVWVENNEILCYLSQSGSFDEDNSLLKAGRLRLKFSPEQNLQNFKQSLNLSQGSQSIQLGDVKVVFWVDVNKPVIHIEINSNSAVSSTVRYESWRYEDRNYKKGETDQNSWKWTLPKDLKAKGDKFENDAHSLWFYHQNADSTIFDLSVKQQGLDKVKSEMFNPLKNRISGGLLWGENLVFENTGMDTYSHNPYKYWSFKSKTALKKQNIELVLFSAQLPILTQWKSKVMEIKSQISKADKKKNQDWWKQFSERSFIRMENTNSPEAEISRNYTLFRYMLACNAYGKWPTRFNGGLFTFDPEGVDSNNNYSPDYRRWTGGTFTAQNQRLVYGPMLKSGDADLMIPQFDFYLNTLKNAELRSWVYWGHKGASYTEQIENYGLPNPMEYGWKRPDYFDKGVEYNAWLEYVWDTALEFSQMIMDADSYAGMDISRYIPFLESSYQFFFEHYSYAAKMRGRKNLDEANHLILFPSSGAETFKMANNPSSTIAGLMKISEGLKSLKNKYTLHLNIDSLSALIPPLPFREIEGMKMISPAKTWERINNVETSQLYPVYPWKIFGLNRPDLEIARNTYLHDPWSEKMRSHVGWKQDLIFAACLGLKDEAKNLVLKKLADGPYRFPAFWGPGFDWSPDHNWGGSGMIGLQEMLLQDGPDGQILVCPSWPSEWNVHFKLHAAQQTTVEAEVKNGNLTIIKVLPEARAKDIINFLNK